MNSVTQCWDTLQDLQPQRSDCPWPFCLQVDWKGKRSNCKEFNSVCLDHERSWTHFGNVSQKLTWESTYFQNFEFQIKRKTISGCQRMWNQIMLTWLGVDYPTTFCCHGNLDLNTKLLTLHFVVRSLPVKAGGSQYELIAIATDVEQNVNEGSDGIEHMYEEKNVRIEKNYQFSCRMCGHKDPYVPLDAKPFGFPFDRKIDFDIHGKENTFRWALLSYN